MSQTITQRLIALLCLVAFGLGQSAFGPWLVKCEGATGQTSFELWCFKSADGSCRTECDSNISHSPEDGSTPADEEGAEHPPIPCKDTPIGGPANAAKILPRSRSIDPVQFVAEVVLIPRPASWAEPPAPALAEPVSAIVRPPDALARLGAIIMTV